MANQNKREIVRPHRPEDQLRTAANQASYEIEMLIHCAQYLGSGHSSPPTLPFGEKANMALEAFLLHFRNLRAFLCPSLQTISTDDILASDFIDELQARDVGDPTVLSRDKQRLDRMLAHLSYSRADFIGADNIRWHTAAMTITILTELLRFLNTLPVGRAGWFTEAYTLVGACEWAAGLPIECDNWSWRALSGDTTRTTTR